MFCVGKKNKKDAGASKTAPKPTLAAAETTASPVSTTIIRKKTFYGPLEDLVPIKVDFVQVKKTETTG
jgi:hypothetical protein